MTYFRKSKLHKSLNNFKNRYMDEILFTSPGLTILIPTNTSLHFFLNNKNWWGHLVLKKV
jgi:hypothetical protein